MNTKTAWCTLFASLFTCVAALRAATLTEDFENVSKSSYAAATLNCPSGSWYLDNLLIGTSASDKKNGSKSVRGYGSFYMQFDKTNGIGTISLFNGGYGSDNMSGVSWQLKISTDQGATWTAFSTNQASIPSSWTQLTFSNINVAGSARIRIDLTGATSNKRVNFDDISLTDYIPVTPLLTVSPQTLNLATTLVSVASASTNFILSGINLTTEAITAIPSDGFEISSDNITFQTSALTFYGSSGTLANTPIYVRLTGSTAGTISGSVSISGGGLTDAVVVTLSGVVEVNAPKVTRQPATFALFEATTNAPSAAQTLTLTGERLTPNAQLTITATGGFEIATEASYATTLFITIPSSGLLTTNISIRLVAQPVIASTVSGAFICEGAGLTEAAITPLAGRISDGRPTTLLAAWNFYGTNSPVSMAATHAYVNMDASLLNLTRGANAASSAGGDSFRTTGFKNLGIDVESTRYFETQLRAANGKKLSIRTIQALLNGTPTYAIAPGVTSQFAYSLDGVTFTVIGSPQTLAGAPQTLAVSNLLFETALQNIPSTTTVTLRYYASGQSTTGGWGFYSSSASANGLEITGIVEIDLNQNQPPTLTVTPQSSVPVAGESVSLLVETFDLENDTVSLAFEGLSDYTFENNLLSWVPVTAGEHQVTIIAHEPMNPQNVITQRVSFSIGLATPTHIEPKATSSHALMFTWAPVIGATSYIVDLFTWTGTPLTLINETLDACTPNGALLVTSNGVAGASTMDIASALPAWSGSSVYGAMQTNYVDGIWVTNTTLVKLGTTSVSGWLQTPELDLARNQGAYTVSFDAGAWYTASESLNMYVIAYDLTSNLATTNLVPISKTEMSHIVLPLTGGTARTAIRFEGLQPSYSRVFLDNIQIVGSESKQYIAQDVQVSGTTCLIQSQQLQSGTTYSGTITAVSGATESDAYAFETLVEIAPTLILLR